jgi:polar amino acid transport system substrate-binding protein
VLRLVADPYPPYQYLKGGAVHGLDHALVTAAFAAAGLEARTELAAWDECLGAVRDGSADAIFQITPNAERTEWMAFSRHFRESRTVLYGRRGEWPEGVGEQGLASLAGGSRLGALSGFSYGPQVDEAPVAVRYPSDAQLLDSLLHGDVDLGLIDAGVAAHLRGGDQRLEQLEGFAATRPLHLACRADRAQIVRDFDRGLAEIGVRVGA